MQFLMGLNDTFIGVRSNILLASPLPNIGQAYSLVIQDEKQREIHVTPVYPGDSASFSVAAQSINFNKFKDNRGQKGMFQSKKGNGICAYSKKPGHTIEHCYRLHGFPSDFKFTNQKKLQGRGQVQANNVFNSEETGVHLTNNAENVQALTQENVAELLQLLQQVKLGNQGASTSDASSNLSSAGPFNEEPYEDW